MVTEDNGTDATALSPDNAFAVLGNETRMTILQTLAEADTPLSFSELRERVGMRDSGQFNYHLDEVEGHFVRKTDHGYELRQAGRRVIGAVLSGAITDDPVIEPTRIDNPCPICDAPTLVAFYEGRVEHYCTECAGYYGRDSPSVGDSTSGENSNGTAEYGYLGSFQLPPAGMQGRTPEELFQAGSTWGLLKLMAVATGVCPHCSAPLTTSVRVCEDHGSTGDPCEQCDNRHATQLEFRCTNCLYGGESAFTVTLIANADVLAFLATHGINPVSPSDPTAYAAAIMDNEEELVSVEPFEARFTFAIDDDTLTVTVDDSLTVTEATYRSAV
jgi:hypothetical protein